MAKSKLGTKQITITEPAFTLRGQDPFAARLVKEWADLAQSAGVDPLKVADARRIADEMAAWPGKKIPD